VALEQLGNGEAQLLLVTCRQGNTESESDRVEPAFLKEKPVTDIRTAGKDRGLGSAVDLGLLEFNAAQRQEQRGGVFCEATGLKFRLKVDVIAYRMPLITGVEQDRSMQAQAAPICHFLK